MLTHKAPTLAKTSSRTHGFVTQHFIIIKRTLEYSITHVIRMETDGWSPALIVPVTLSTFTMTFIHTFMTVENTITQQVHREAQAIRTQKVCSRAVLSGVQLSHCVAAYTVHCYHTWRIAEQSFHMFENKGPNFIWLVKTIDYTLGKKTIVNKLVSPKELKR